MAAKRVGRGSGTASVGISVELNEKQLLDIKRGLRAAGPAARREMRSRMKDVGQIIKREIDSRAPVHTGGAYGTGRRARRSSGTSGGKSYKQTHAPGLLKKSTRLKLGNLSVRITNVAKAYSRRYPGGYKYGKRIEFDTTTYGVGGTLENGTAVTPYAFFYPGYEAVKDRASKAFDAVLYAARRGYIRGR